MKPVILLTNDDGVTSEGLWAAYDALADIAEIHVFAPSTQQSAVGRSISIFDPIRAHKVVLHGQDAHAVDGKPTDCVILALYAFGIKPDMVVSGINIGENLSFESIMTSGTIGAALEAANHGPPAVAFSIQVSDQGEKFDNPQYSSANFEHAKTAVRDIVLRLLEKGFPAGTDVVNVNMPPGPYAGYATTTLARKLFHTGVETRVDPRGRPYYWINGPLVDEAPPGTDVHAVHHGMVSITPITLDSTAHADMGAMKELFSKNR